MGTVFTVVVVIFVVAVLLVAAYALFEMSPFSRHKDHYRNSAGERRYEPPNLEDGHY